MAKKILLIESDGAFAQELSDAIEARGLEARSTADGKEGLELVRADRPDLIVLSVELPRMSGYSVCNKLKKDDDLRSIPLVIVSAEATPETFDQHRKLKTHADDYLIKPFAPAELLRKIAALVELPAEPAEDEVVTLEDVEELEVLGGTAGALGEERTTPVALAAAAAAEDEDLKLLDDAFDSLAADDATGMTAIDGAGPAPAAAAAAMPAPPPPPAPEPEIALDIAPPSDEVDRLGDEADEALAALGREGAPELDLVDPAALLDDDAPTLSGDDLLRRAGIELDPPLTSAPAGRVTRADEAASRAEAAGAEEREAALERELGAFRAALEEQQELVRAADAARLAAEEQARTSAAEAEESAARAAREEAARRAAEERAAESEEKARAATRRADAAEQQAAQLRREVEDIRQEAARLGGEAAQAQERADGLARELQDAQGRADEHESAVAALQPELEALRSGLAEAEGAAASARADAERALAEREERLADLEAQNAKHEERVVKAYQKIKGDEKMREKARKALAIALQLLEDRPAASPITSAGEVASRRE